jgi:hypothetical protein
MPSVAVRVKSFIDYFILLTQYIANAIKHNIIMPLISFIAQYTSSLTVIHSNSIFIYLFPKRLNFLSNDLGVSFLT